jgi:hypothetical protein
MNMRPFAVLLAVFALCGVPAAGQDEAAALLAKHKAYVGWEFGDGTFKTLRIEGTISRLGKDGKPKPIWTYVDARRGIIHRESWKSLETGGESLSGFTGSTFWYSDENGLTVPIVSETLKTDLAEAVLFNEATTVYSAAVIRRDTINGKPIVVLREKMPSATVLDLSIDPQTGAYARAVIDPGDRARTIEVDGYDELIPGKRLISSWHYPDSKNRHIEKAFANPPLSDDDFRPPPQKASWTFASPKPFPIEVKEQSNLPQRIFILASINGHEGRFIFDTGAEGIFFTKEFAARAGLKRRPAALTVGTLYGDTRGYYVDVDSLAFGDGSVLKNFVAIQDQELDFGRERADGLIGFTLLAGAIVDVDFDAAQMTLYDPKVTAPDESHGFVVIADLSGGVPSVPIKLNRTTNLNALVDTGDYLHVLIPAQLSGKILVRRGNFAGLDPAGWGAAGGAIQRSAASAWRYETPKCGTLTSIQFGPVNYEAPPFCFSDAIEPGAALIGLDFLKNFNMVFDYPDSKIIMVPRKNVSR